MRFTVQRNKGKAETGMAYAPLFLGIAVTSVGLGVLMDALLPSTALDPATQFDVAGELVPPAVSLVVAILVVLLAIKPVRSIIARVGDAPFVGQSTERTEP